MSQVEDQAPAVTKIGVLDMQVCVPAEWTDEQVEEFANHENLCGTIGGWQIRKEGSQFLDGAPERVSCQERSGFVHIMLDA